MASRKSITDRALKALPPAPAGKRMELWDSRVPGFGVRISDTEDADPARRGKAGKITFVLYARFSPGTAPTRRVIGVYSDAMTLEGARTIAGEWRSLVDKGIDPAAVEVEKIATDKIAAELRIKHSFRAVAEVFIADKLSRERKGKSIEIEMRTVLIAAWGDKPISEITDLDVLEIINPKKRRAPEAARGHLVLAKRFFNWAIDQHAFGIKHSPCERLKALKVIGDRVPRQRRLSEDEIRAFWRATGRMGAVGAAYRMLLLTALRLNEVADISRPEIKGDLLTVPASRMKAKDSRAREHLVPLSPLAIDLIASHNAKPYLFSHDGGASPLWLATKAKRELDRRMLRTLRALARIRGEDYRKVTLSPWRNHDVRRTVRSELSALRVPETVCEAVLAHKPPCIIGTYDVYAYFDEKREALEAWAKRLTTIVNPDREDNVVALRPRR